MSSPNNADLLLSYTTNCQILLLYKTWRYYNKFDSTKSLGVCYWCVKLPQCGCMEHGLKHITFNVQKHIYSSFAKCYNAALVHDKPLGPSASVKLVCCYVSWDHVIGDYFYHISEAKLTVFLYSPNGRHLPAVRAVQGDCETVYPISHHLDPNLSQQDRLISLSLFLLILW